MKKRLFVFILLAAMAIGLSATNAITTETLTLVSGTTYRIATANYYKMNLLLDYAKGDSTSVTVTIGYRYTDTGIPATTTYIASMAGSGNVAENDEIVMSATAARQFALSTSKRADWLYLTFTFDGGTTATLRADVILDYTQ